MDKENAASYAETRPSRRHMGTKREATNNCNMALRQLGQAHPQNHQPEGKVLGNRGALKPLDANKAQILGQRVQPKRAVKQGKLADGVKSGPAFQPLGNKGGASFPAFSAASNSAFNVFVDEEEAAGAMAVDVVAPVEPMQTVQSQVMEDIVEAAPTQLSPEPDVLPMVVESSADDDCVIVEEVVERRARLLAEMDGVLFDQHMYMRMRETVGLPSLEAIDHNQREVTYNMRTILMDWLIEVAEEYKLKRETLFLAVGIIDRTLSKLSIVKSKLQLMGAAAMFIAAKYEEIYPPDVGEFVYITDDTYTKKQVLRMESVVLRTLHFDVALVTANAFLEMYACKLRCSKKLTAHAMYFSELTMVYGESFMNVAPSMVAAACLCYARHSQTLCSWPENHRGFTGYSSTSLRPVLMALQAVVRDLPSQPQKAVLEKYKQAVYHGVAGLPAPDALAV